MGKRIIQQARGKGSLTYRVRKQAFSKRISYPRKEGKAEIISILHSPAHSAPLAKIKIDKETFFIPAFNNSFVEQKIEIGENAKPEIGNILPLKNIPEGTEVYNIERNPNDGGKMMRTAGSAALLLKKLENNIIIIAMPNKKQVKLHPNCRATIGRIAGDGRKLKPFVTAGKKFYKMKAKSKLWPRTSAVKVNAVDHPFGSGRGKRVGSKIAQRNASPGQKVGHIRPRRTGHKR
ncbi:MAG: 50S ribosomal protein L2 [archaeon]